MVSLRYSGTAFLYERPGLSQDTSPVRIAMMVGFWLAMIDPGATEILPDLLVG